MRVKTSKIRFGVGVGVIALFAWALPACSDDDDGGSGGSSGSGGAGATGGGAGSGTGGGAGASTGGGSGTGGSAGAGTGGSAGASTGNCVGQEAGLQATYGPDDKTVAEITGDCARGDCLAIATEAENKKCVNDCVQAIVMDAVTSACTACYADTAWCSRSNCIAECIDGGDDCTQCQCDNNCISSFETCSGTTSTTTCN